MNGQTRMRRGGARVRIEAGLVAMLSVLAFPSVALAEVMDKEPNLRRIWAWALCAGLAGLVCWPIVWPVGLVAALVGAVFFFVLFGEITDPYVGPAIVNEAGHGYVRQSYLALAIFVILHGLGLALRVRRRRASAMQD